MDDRVYSTPGAEHQPVGGPASPPVPPAGGGLDDPRLLQILSTEHWSLLSARSLVYNEAFTRAGMFLTFLSASLVALAFAASAMAFSRDFLVLAVALLTLDLIIGLATVGRILDATLDDLRAIQGMNRIRHAYVELVPEALPYFVTSIHDDSAGVMATYGEPPSSRGALAAFLHGLTTTNSVVSIISSLLAGVVTGILGIVAGLAGTAAFVVGAAVFVGLFLAIGRYALGTIRRFEAEMDARFPTPAGEATAAPGKR